MTAEREALSESLRDTADRFRGWSYSGDADPDPRVLMRRAAGEIDRFREALTRIAKLVQYEGMTKTTYGSVESANRIAREALDG